MSKFKILTNFKIIYCYIHHIIKVRKEGKDSIISQNYERRCWKCHSLTLMISMKSVVEFGGGRNVNQGKACE
ncbi:HNH endonuclease [Bacillus sp. sid0103]|nr:HNH endonuclease [Bacillus sp. sid0103]